MHILGERVSVSTFLYIQADESGFSTLVWSLFSGKRSSAIIQSGNKSELAAGHKHTSLFSCRDRKLQIQSQVLFFVFSIFFKSLSSVTSSHTFFFFFKWRIKLSTLDLSLLSTRASPPLRGANVQMRLIKLKRLFIYLFSRFKSALHQGNLWPPINVKFSSFFFFIPSSILCVCDSCHWLSAHS